MHGHQLQPLADESVLLGLGDVVDARETIPEPFRAELVAQLARYATVARELGAGAVAFVGTQPLRRAADAAAVVVAVSAATGVPLHVLAHEEEGLLNLLGATHGQPVAGPLAVVDVGGGSTEVVLVEPGAHARSVGLPTGGSALSRRVDAHDPPTLADLDALRDAARLAVAAAPAGRPAAMIAVGGTSSNLVKVVPAAGRDRMITPRRLAAARRRFAAEPAALVATRFQITPRRASLLPAGAAILAALMEHYGVVRVTAVEAGIREGVVVGLYRAGAGWRDHLDAMAHGWAAPAQPATRLRARRRRVPAGGGTSGR